MKRLLFSLALLVPAVAWAQPVTLGSSASNMTVNGTALGNLATLSGLSGLDASAATVTATGGTAAHKLNDISAGYLWGRGTSGSYDALLNVSGGGFEPGLGIVQMTGAGVQFVNYDGAVNVLIPGVPNAVDQIMLLGGMSQAGGTVASSSAVDANVDLSFSAQNLGNQWFYNGSGALLELVSPTTPVAENLTITPATVASPGMVLGTSGGSYPLALNMGTGAIMLGCPPDGTAKCGNTRGYASVDLQVNRTQNYMVTLGGSSFLFPGSGSYVNAPYAAAGGYGSFVNSSGTTSFAYGNTAHVAAPATAAFGLLASDRGNTGTFAFGMGYNSDNGSPVQLTLRGLHAYTASLTQTRLIAGGPASVSAQNVWGIDLDEVMITGDLVVSGFDTTAPTTNWVRWRVNGFTMVRGTGVASVTVTPSGAVTVDRSAGTGSSALLSVTADDTYGGINCAVTAPSTNKWKWGAMLTALEVQGP